MTWLLLCLQQAGAALPGDRRAAANPGRARQPQARLGTRQVRRLPSGTLTSHAASFRYTHTTRGFLQVHSHHTRGVLQIHSHHTRLPPGTLTPHVALLVHSHHTRLALTITSFDISLFSNYLFSRSNTNRLISRCCTIQL